MTNGVVAEACARRQKRAIQVFGSAVWAEQSKKNRMNRCVNWQSRWLGVHGGGDENAPTFRLPQNEIGVFTERNWLCERGDCLSEGACQVVVWCHWWGRSRKPIPLYNGSLRPR